MIFDVTQYDAIIHEHASDSQRNNCVKMAYLCSGVHNGIL